MGAKLYHMCLPHPGESCMSPIRCGEHCASVLAHLAKVLAMPKKPKNEALRTADCGDCKPMGHGPTNDQPCMAAPTDVWHHPTPFPAQPCPARPSQAAPRARNLRSWELWHVSLYKLMQSWLGPMQPCQQPQPTTWPFRVCIGAPTCKVAAQELKSLGVQWAPSWVGPK